MLSELHHFDSDYEALVWAMSCFSSGIRVRVHAMDIGTFTISRWVLAPEMALCFVPLTMGWLDVVFGGSGIVRFNMDIVQQYFLGVPGGTAALVTILAEAVLGVLGPVGLFLAIRVIALNRAIRNRPLGTTLVVGSILLGVVFIANRVISGSNATVWELAGALVLFSVLPAAGVAHMLYLGARNANRELTA
jgi:hypothetical protein